MGSGKSGVAPDIDVDMDPKAVAAGHDPQLERAVAVAMEELKKNPPPQPHKPAYPNYNGTVNVQNQSATAGN